MQRHVPSIVSRTAMAAILGALLAGCSSFGGSGPSTRAVTALDGQAYDTASIAVVDLDRAVTQRLASARQERSFAAIFGGGAI